MKTTIKTSLMTAAIGVAMGAVGCSHAPSNELVGARHAYGQAKSGPAHQVVPDEVYEAKMALDDAERAFKADPGDQEEIHLAYIARRKAEIAMAKADIKLTKQNEVKARQQFGATLAEQRNTARQTLEGEREQGKAEELADARRGRAQAEADAQRAMQELERFAQVYRDQKTDETVITLSGQILFETGKATLMPVAERRLEQVAKALKKQGDGQKIVIEGHTDTRGSDALNERLSRQRAQAVKDFFGRYGIDPSRVEAVGRGESDPIATNDTAEGRANNRRVEIILSEGDSAKTAQR